jgi:transcriptional regulator with XRE-family HTH domain
MDFKQYFKKNPPAKLSDKQEIAIKLGGLITSVRLHFGLSQSQLAKKIGTQQPSLARAEAGDVEPSFMFLYKIAKAIGQDDAFLERLVDLFGAKVNNPKAIYYSWALDYVGSSSKTLPREHDNYNITSSIKH